MKTPEKLYYKIGAQNPASVVADYFKQDAIELTRQAEEIIGQSFSPALAKKVTRKPK